MRNSISDLKLEKPSQFYPFCLQFDDCMYYLNRREKIIRENAFEQRKKKPGLKFNPRLGLIDLQTTGARR